MIRHIVFFTLKDRADLDRVQAALSRLAEIPCAKYLEVARNNRHDTLSSDIDLVVYREFDNGEDLAAYKADPLYAETIRLVRPLRDRRYAVDDAAPAPPCS